MSTAQTLRKAAVTWPVAHLDEVTVAVVYAYMSDGDCVRNMYSYNQLQMQTFKLLVASALDGGEREPMGSKERIPILDQFYDDHLSMAEFIKLVERHHGIGINK